MYILHGYWLNWQETDWTPWSQTGITNWGTSLGWCNSDLDAMIGFFSSADECWNSCSDIFGNILYSIDFWAEGELGDCYCQQDCFCMETIGDDS
jgi:hypothetical protein